MKTSELTGHALNWAVAKCMPDDTLAVYFDEETGEPLCYDDWEVGTELFNPSTDWSQGGPIIEREQISLGDNCPQGWEASRRKGVFAVRGFGPTPLVAAMRCYVASKLGDEIELPKELQV